VVSSKGQRRVENYFLYSVPKFSVAHNTLYNITVYIYIMCEDDDDCPCCSCCSQKCQDRSLLVLVAILIGFAYMSWWIVVAIHWQWWTTSFGLINTIVFNFIVLMIVVSWVRTIYSDPGFNPPGWVSHGKFFLNNNVLCLRYRIQLVF